MTPAQSTDDLRRLFYRHPNDVHIGMFGMLNRRRWCENHLKCSPRSTDQSYQRDVDGASSARSQATPADELRRNKCSRR